MSDSENIEMDEWLFVLVEKSNNGEKIIGHQDSDRGIRFIPTFKDRSSALKGAARLNIDTEYEVHAIIYEDLLHYASNNQSLIFLLNGKGNPLLKIAPDGRAL